MAAVAPAGSDFSRRIDLNIVGADDTLEPVPGGTSIFLPFCGALPASSLKFFNWVFGKLGGSGAALENPDTSGNEVLFEFRAELVGRIGFEFSLGAILLVSVDA